MAEGSLYYQQGEQEDLEAKSASFEKVGYTNKESLGTVFKLVLLGMSGCALGGTALYLLSNLK